MLVFEKIATLEEIERSWSLTDVNKAYAILDLKAEIANQQSKREIKK